ncbi:odorant receptor 10a-like [Papilio machaon]|uniref:odorant receptor 10a-like n=1 Tax=Papilio machaon TaxID=76193 RepID=UPI001E665CF1|nr:odorant receptor 10a-like [Papilio machaon]
MRNFILKFKNKLTDNSFENLIWLINLFPNMLGFSYFGVKIKGKCYNGIWKSLINLLELANKNNNMAMESETSADKLKQIIKSIKKLIIIWYLFHLINGVFVFIPKRISEMNDCSLSSCVGLKPLSERPNKEACMVILTAHALFCIITTAAYDATFLFLFAHTASMFEILKEETISLNEIYQTSKYEHLEDTQIVTERLKNLINRHSLILHTVKKIQSIYNIAVGISLGLEAISMCLFFVLPFEAVLNLVPIIIHGLSMFFLYCYQGQKITTAAEGFEMAVYCCGWENFDIKEQKMILIMLRQSQKPVILKAASVAPICIYSFACTMQSIYKLVTAFKT